MNNEKVSTEKLVDGYRRAFEAQVQADPGLAACGVLYQFQDTTYCKYNDRNKLDLGYMETPNDNGLLLHTALLTDGGFNPVGIPYQRHIVRDRGGYGKGRQRKQRSFEEKESHKWVEAMEWSVGFRQRTGKEVVHVMDREGDLAGMFGYAARHGLGFIVRARHDRKLANGSTLFAHLDGLAADAVVERDIFDEKGRPLRITVGLCTGEVVLADGCTVLRFVHVRQIGAAQGADPLKWTLLTSLVPEQGTGGVGVLDTYTHRWRTCEDFHKCLKTGCAIEGRQFDSAHALCNAIALLSMVALRLLRMRHLAQAEKGRDAAGLLSKDELGLANELAKKYLKPADLSEAAPGTVLWLTLLIGRMGGHQGIRQKGMPGWQTLWKGWQLFQSLMDGINLSKNFLDTT
jgi:hypothetical protein